MFYVGMYLRDKRDKKRTITFFLHVIFALIILNVSWVFWCLGATNLNKMRNLAQVSKEEQATFLNSFDKIFSDVDGVIWLLAHPIEGADKGVRSLQSLGKEIHFVTNNMATAFHQRLKHINAYTKANFQEKHFITPLLPLLKHLKDKKFSKEIFVIGTESLKGELRKHGFKVADEDVNVKIEESLTALASHLTDNENIGAVVFDHDYNFNYLKIMKAAVYLKRPDVLFLAGMPDVKSPLNMTTVLLGPVYFYRALEDISERTITYLGKPSDTLANYLLEAYEIDDPSRCLFMGDSISSDMATGTKCGFQKLLVLSGSTTMKDVEKWDHPEEFKPEYYVECLKKLHEIITENEFLKRSHL